MYYQCSENKGADQLRGYREADLRLCFRLCKNPVFSRCGSYDLGLIIFDTVKAYMQLAKRKLILQKVNFWFGLHHVL